MTDRRSFIAGLAVASVAVASPSIAATSAFRPAWDIALAAEQSARSEMDTFHAKFIAPADAAYSAGTGSIEEVLKLEDAWSSYTSRHAESVNNILATPAPDLAAVAFKIDMGVADCAFDHNEQSVRSLRLIAADIRRLA